MQSFEGFLLFIPAQFISSCLCSLNDFTVNPVSLDFVFDIVLCVSSELYPVKVEYTLKRPQPKNKTKNTTFVVF